MMFEIKRIFNSCFEINSKQTMNFLVFVRQKAKEKIKKKNVSITQ